MNNSIISFFLISALLLSGALAQDPYIVEGISGANPTQIFNGDDDPSDLAVTNYGDLDHHDSLTKVFQITNTSDKDIEILSIESSNSQFPIVSSDLGPIEPNEVAGFAIRFDALHGEEVTEIVFETDASGRFDQFSFHLVGNGVPLTWYVDISTTTPGTGKSWTFPFADLQDALALALTGDEILVAQGVYYPDEGTGQTNDAANSTFLIPEHVSLRGGYATGGTSRDIDTFVTILSGDIAQNDNNSDGNFILEDPDLVAGLNAGPVVTFEATSNNISLIEGFTITAGDNRNTTGGGVSGTWGSRLSVLQCDFIGNRARNSSSSTSGGGLSLSTVTEAIIEDCLFESNLVEAPTTPRGGGCNIGAHEARAERCLWRGNQVRNSSSPTLDVDGTAFYHRGSGSQGAENSLTILDCEFLEHQAPDRGHSVLYVFNTFEVEVDRCRFAGNSFSGQIFNCCLRVSGVRTVDLTNSLFHGNELGTQMIIEKANPINTTVPISVLLRNVTMAGNSGVGVGQINFPQGGLAIYNSVFHDNSLGHLPSASSNFSVLVGSSLVGGDPAHSNHSGNLDKDTQPNFVSAIPAALAPVQFGNYNLFLNSPLIDAGSNLSVSALDLNGESRLQDGDGDGEITADIGAYEHEFMGALIEIVSIDYNPSNGTIVFTIEADKAGTYDLYSESALNIDFSNWNRVKGGSHSAGTSQITVNGSQYGWPAAKMFFRFQSPGDVS